MASDLDLLRSAKLVLDHHGQDALTFAARRADALLERGDPQGYTLSTGLGRYRPSRLRGWPLACQYGVLLSPSDEGGTVIQDL